MPIYQEKNKSKQTKDGRSWYFKTYINGKQYESKKYLRKKEAQEEEELFNLKKKNPLHKPFNLVALDYFHSLENSSKKESTIYSYKKDYNKHIEPFFNNMDIFIITTQVIADWTEYMLNKELSIGTLNKIKNILNSIFDFAIKKYELEKNPSKIYGPFEQKKDEVIVDEEKIRYITLEEFNKFISVIDNEMWKSFFIFAFYTGCRKGEIQALTWKDVDFKNNEIIINKTLSIKNVTTTESYKITSTKNNLNRKVKMSKTLSDTLLQYKKEVSNYIDFNDSWFVFGNVRFLPQITIDRYKHKFFALSSVKEITMHEFRHSHVSLLINEYIRTSKEKNMKVDTAKFFLMMSNRMGHTIDVMQRTYMHLFPTIQDEIIDLLDNL